MTQVGQRCESCGYPSSRVVQKENQQQPQFPEFITKAGLLALLASLLLQQVAGPVTPIILYLKSLSAVQKTAFPNWQVFLTCFWFRMPLAHLEPTISPRGAGHRRARPAPGLCGGAVLQQHAADEEPWLCLKPLPRRRSLLCSFHLFPATREADRRALKESPLQRVSMFGRNLVC